MALHIQTIRLQGIMKIKQSEHAHQYSPILRSMKHCRVGSNKRRGNQQHDAAYLVLLYKPGCSAVSLKVLLAYDKNKEDLQL